MPPLLYVQLRHQDEIYKFPYLEVCFDRDSEGVGEGCDVSTSREDGQEDCIDTVNATTFDACGAPLDDVPVIASSNATVRVVSHYRINSSSQTELNILPET